MEALLLVAVTRLLFWCILLPCTKGAVAVKLLASLPMSRWMFAVAGRVREICLERELLSDLTAEGAADYLII